MMWCSDCMRKNHLHEVGYDIWPGGEEFQYQCSCSSKIRSVVYDWENGEIRYHGIYARTNRIEWEE